MEETKSEKKKSSAWPIAITVIVLAVLAFGVYVVNRVDKWAGKAEILELGLK